MRKLIATSIFVLGSFAMSYAVTPDPQTKVEEKSKTEKCSTEAKKSCGSETKAEGKSCCSKAKK